MWDLKLVTMEEEEVGSPCISVCTHDTKGVCYGCKRTREEVGDWSKYTNEEKKAVLDKLPYRTHAEEMGGFSF
jgi:predicted Fe-S protein YdhL (DUF1289 family)